MLKSKKSTAGTRTRSRAAIAVIAATLLVGGTATASAKARHHHRPHHLHMAVGRHHLHVARRRHHPHDARRLARAGSRHAHAQMAFFGTGRVFTGLASYYGSGRRTASGQRFNPHALTCAHRSLPFGTKLLVTHDGRSVVVTVNDRGPFVRGRVLDLTTAAARAVGLTGAGVGRVTFRVIS